MIELVRTVILVAVMRESEMTPVRQGSFIVIPGVGGRQQYQLRAAIT